MSCPIYILYSLHSKEQDFFGHSLLLILAYFVNVRWIVRSYSVEDMEEKWKEGDLAR